MRVYTFMWIGDLDHLGGGAVHLFHRLGEDRQELAVAQHHLRLTMVEDSRPPYPHPAAC